MVEKCKVLFIAGNGRSGSTLLDVILGQLEGFFAVGELRRIWDRSLIENRPCGCEVPFRECETWNAIFQEAYGGINQIDPSKMVQFREQYTQTKHLPRMLLNKKGENRQSLQEFLGNLDKLYRAIHKITRCEVIVDASKWPMYAYMLGSLPSVELYVLHLVRDPRASAFSWMREKKGGDPVPQQGTFRSTLYWLAWNPSIEYLWNRRNDRYFFLPYERFVINPQLEISQIVAFLKERERKLPFKDEITVELGKTHAVAGNIARQMRGPVQIQVDDEWKEKMSFSKKLLVSSLTWPWMLKYGYFAGLQM